MEDAQFHRIAKALADPRRFRVLQTLAAAHEVGCQRLCEVFPVSQATISYHLKELANAGLVEPRREGQFVYYRVRAGVVEDYLEELRVRMRAPGGAPAG